MTKLKKHKHTPFVWIAYIIVIVQAIYNPVISTVSTIQIYLANALLLILLVSKVLFGKETSDSRLKSDSFPIWVYFGYCLIFILSSLAFGINQFALGNFARLSSLLLMISLFQGFSKSLESLVNLYFLLNCCIGLILLIKFSASGIDISNRISPAGQGNANCFGATVSLISLLRISLRNSFSHFQNLCVYFFGMPISILTILGTYSRGATLGFTIGLVFIGLQKSKYTHAPKIIGLVLLLVFILEILKFSNSSLLSRFSAESFIDSSGRNIIFRNALDSFIKNPIFGSGVSSRMNPFFSGEASTHNVFLQVVGETGLLGLIFLLLLLALVVSRYHPKLSAPALACLFIVSLTDNHFLAVQFHLAVSIVYLVLLQDRNGDSIVKTIN